MDNFDLDLNIDLDLTGNDDKNSDLVFTQNKPSRLNPKLACYKKAKDLAESIEITKGGYAYCLISGLFEFSEFVEAFLCERGHFCDEMTISTLSLSKDSAFMLANCFHRGHLKKMNLLISDFFFAHERKKGGILDLLYHEMQGFNFRLGVTRSHMKIICMDLVSTGKNAKVVIHGSANLRSSGSFEQMAIEENPSLYQFNYEVINDLISDYEVKGRTTNTTKIFKGIQSTIKNKLENGR